VLLLVLVAAWWWRSRTRSVAMMFGVDAFCDHLTLERGLSPRTVDAYRRDLERLVAFMRRGRGAARGRGRSGAARVRLSPEGPGPAASSIRRSVSAVRTYFGYLLAEGVVVADPTDRVELPRAWRRLPGVLSREEVAASSTRRTRRTGSSGGTRRCSSSPTRPACASAS
jgi:integrase/recombinase XerD